MDLLYKMNFFIFSEFLSLRKEFLHFQPVTLLCQSLARIRSKSWRKGAKRRKEERKRKETKKEAKDKSCSFQAQTEPSGRDREDKRRAEGIPERNIPVALSSLNLLSLLLHHLSRSSLFLLNLSLSLCFSFIPSSSFAFNPSAN